MKTKRSIVGTSLCHNTGIRAKFSLTPVLRRVSSMEISSQLVKEVIQFLPTARVGQPDEKEKQEDSSASGKTARAGYVHPGFGETAYASRPPSRSTHSG